MVGVLRRALELDQFEVHYQPLFRTNGELVSLEALIRLQRPGSALTLPEQFIPIAEESGLIIPIGNWVIRQVSRQIREWQAAGHSPVKVAVNVSAVQLVRADFADTVARIIDEEGVAPSLLELELTETELLLDWKLSLQHMHQLRALGLTISIDDFGTGYSSLNHLHSLPVDNIKIDQSFVQNLDAPISSLPVVRSIISLAHQLGLTVTAEGIETEQQLRTVRDLDCDKVQGYLLQRPAAAEVIESAVFEDQENLYAGSRRVS